ncbi:uncharacterized protein [Antedon mediterranea]|uniref:uncharacterized protein n=1 Tax=Antedon mediterranea TaxID=105859 RepID=UPI003AF63CD0
MSSIFNRKALLKQLPADQRFSKHRACVDTIQTTPGGYEGPPLGEVDLTQDGETVFKFSSPSLKFADESFCGFNATPVKTEKFLNLTTPKTATPGKGRLRKLNPLNSKKFKRRSFGPLTHTLGGGTPSSDKGAVSISSIKKKLGHRSIKLQATPVPDRLAPGESIGWRLANRPPKKGLGTLKVVDDALAGQTKRSHQKSSSSPAKVLTSNKMYTKSSFGSGPAVTIQDIHYGKVATPQKDNTKSPKVMLVDVQMSWKGPVRNVNQETVANNNNNQVDQPAPSMPTAVVHVGRKYDSSLKRQGPVTPNTANKYRGNSVRMHCNHLASPESSPEFAPPSPPNPVVQHSEHANPAPVMHHSASQKSLSSVLSNISVTSTKSVFSVECNYNNVDEEHRPSSVIPPPIMFSNENNATTTVGYYRGDCTNKQASINQNHTNVHKAYNAQMYSGTKSITNSNTYGNTQDYIDTHSIQYGGEDKKLGDGTTSKTSSLDSLDTLGSEEELKAHQKLKKSTSVDSGRGASLYDSEGMYKIEDIAIMIKNLEQTNEENETSNKVNYAPSYAVNMNTKSQTLSKHVVQPPHSCEGSKLVQEGNSKSKVPSAFYNSLPRGMNSTRTEGFNNRSQWQYSSCTLPSRRVKRSQTCPDGIGSLDARRLSNSVVEANVEFSSTEDNSPLKMLNRTPLRFSSRGRRPSLPSQPSEPMEPFQRSERFLRKSFSAGSGVRSPKFPLTSLVKSISSESGLSRVDTQEPFDDDDDEEDDSDEEEDIFKSRIPKNHFKQRPRFSQTHEPRFQKLTPCQEADDEEVTRKYHRPAPLVENCSDNVLEEVQVIKQVSLPLHLAKSTKVRGHGKKTVTHKYGTPTKSKRFGFLSKSKEDGNSTPKHIGKSPKRYPRSPVNPLNNPSGDLSSAVFTGEF